jgi:hypothetical protein
MFGTIISCAVLTCAIVNYMVVRREPKTAMHSEALVSFLLHHVHYLLWPKFGLFDFLDLDTGDMGVCGSR